MAIDRPHRGGVREPAPTAGNPQPKAAHVLSPASTNINAQRYPKDFPAFEGLLSGRNRDLFAGVASAASAAEDRH
jgi:hypothetical protein